MGRSWTARIWVEHNHARGAHVTGTFAEVVERGTLGPVLPVVARAQPGVQDVTEPVLSTERMLKDVGAQIKQCADLGLPAPPPLLQEEARLRVTWDLSIAADPAKGFAASDVKKCQIESQQDVVTAAVADHADRIVHYTQAKDAVEAAQLEAVAAKESLYEAGNMVYRCRADLRILQQERAALDAAQKPPSALQTASFERCVVASVASSAMEDLLKTPTSDQKAWIAERFTAILHQWIQHGPCIPKFQHPSVAAAAAAAAAMAAPAGVAPTVNVEASNPAETAAGADDGLSSFWDGAQDPVVGEVAPGEKDSAAKRCRTEAGSRAAEEVISQPKPLGQTRSANSAKSDARSVLLLRQKHEEEMEKAEIQFAQEAAAATEAIVAAYAQEQ